MARARNIKPSFFDNDALAENDPLGRLLFIGLWTLCDFNGNLEWRSKRIQKQLLAYDKCDIDKLAINLDKSGFVRFYSDGEKIYLNVVNFVKHQNPHKNERAKGSEIPDFTEEMRQLVDLKDITINLDKSGLKQECSHSNPADSLFLNPDSLFLNPDSLILIPDTNTPESGEPNSRAAKAAIDFSPLCMTDEQVCEVKRIRRKNKGGAMTQRVVNGLAKEFEQAARIGWSPDDILNEWELRGWKSFKAEWVKPKGTAYDGMSAISRKNAQNLAGDW